MNSVVREHRLAGFNSYTGRFFERFKQYDYSDPFQVGAAVTHGATQFLGLDPATRDLGRYFDGDKSPVPRLEGLMPRTREDTIGAVQDVFHGKVFSAVTKVINVVGDVVADGADAVAGVK